MGRSKKKARSTVGAAEQATGFDFASQESHLDYTTQSECERGRIYNFLPTGADHAISKEMLRKITGMGDRELRMEIQRERLCGCQILTNCETGGYYRPANTDDSTQFIRSMRRRAAEISAVADAVERAMLKTSAI